jgi:hypothetical protein
VRSSTSDCGACGNACAPGATCVSGTCTCAPSACSCAAPASLCEAEGVCADLALDPRNCGVCGDACSADQHCASGSCQCPAGEASCGGGRCTSLASVASCGTCGAACTGSDVCGFDPHTFASTSVTCVAACTLAGFGLHAEFTTGATPGSIAIGDFDRDGNLDLAVVNLTSDTTTILLGNGDGTFRDWGSSSLGPSTNALAAADLNADGKLDLVTAALSGTVGVLLGSGDGTFLPRVDHATAGSPYAVAIADLNGDGVPDVVASVNPLVFDPSGSTTFFVSVLPGDGKGSLLPHVDTSLGTTFFGVQGIAVGHLYGGAPLDLAVGVDGGVAVLRGIGDGTFEPYDLVTTGGGWGEAVVIADLDGDGKDDVVFTDPGTNHVTVLLGNGDGTFQPHADYGTPDDPLGLAVADVNGDGRLDLVVVGNGTDLAPGDTVSVFLGNGDGTFQAGTPYVTAGSPRGIVLGDLDGDGRPDVAVTAGRSGPGSVSVLLGQCLPR